MQPRNYFADTNMTPTFQRIQSTPMAPYVGLMEKMSNQDKVAVATFLLASVPNVKVVEEQPVMTNSEIIREKYKNLKRSPRVEKLMLLREEAAKYVDLTDERTKHILGLDDAWHRRYPLHSFCCYVIVIMVLAVIPYLMLQFTNR